MKHPAATKARGALIVAVVLALGGLYFSGRLDHLLYNLGLNYHECARNGLGAVFCGSELTEYRERIAKAKQESEAAERKISEASAEARQKEEAAERQEAQERADRRAALEAQVTPQKKAEASATPEGSPARVEYESARMQLQAEGR